MVASAAEKRILRVNRANLWSELRRLTGNTDKSYTNMMGIKTLLLIFLFVTLETTLATGRLPGVLMLGAPVNISRNDPELKKVVLIAASSYNNRSNDAFLFKPSAIGRAQRQVVKGHRYIVDFDISRTVCRKQDNIKNLYNCDLQPEGPLHQTFQCHFEVWLIPWEKKTEIQAFLCKSETSH